MTQRNTTRKCQPRKVLFGGGASGNGVRPTTQQRVRRVGALALGALAMLAVLPGLLVTASPSASADVGDFSFSEYHVDYELGRNAAGHATLSTEERFVAAFPAHDQNRGIVRMIPLDYDGVPLHTELLAVTDGSGEAVPYETWEEDGYLMVAVGDDSYLHGETTFLLEYEQENTIRSFADTKADEFYWDTNGIAWQQSFASASATLTVTEELVPALTGNQFCYQGSLGDTERCSISQDAQQPARFTAKANGALAAQETLTLAVGFTPGTFEIPVDPARTWWATALPGALTLLSVGGVAWFGRVRSRLWGHQPGRGLLVPQYGPPADMDLLEAGLLIDRAQSVVPASVIDLAVRGAVRVQDTGTNPKKPKFSLQFVSKNGLSDHEWGFVVALYGHGPKPGETIPLGKTDAARAKRVGDIITALPKRLTSRGFLNRAPGSLPRATKWTALGLSALSLALGGVVFFLTNGGGWALLSVMVSAIVLIIAVGLSFRPVRRTQLGSERREEIEGIKAYVELAERDRFAMLQSVRGAERVDTEDTAQLVHLYERLLPYAVLWGVDKEWARELGKCYEVSGTQPGWYSSTDGFTGAGFALGMGRLAQQTSQAVTAPGESASGGSFSGGSGGGGFAGGGGGGGGGGGR